MRHNPYYDREIQEAPLTNYNTNDLYNLGQLTKEEKLEEENKIMACSESPKSKSVKQL